MLTGAANSQIASEVPTREPHNSTIDAYRSLLPVCSFKDRFCVQPEVSLTSIRKDMEAAKLELQAYSVTLTELISKIGKILSNR